MRSNRYAFELTWAKGSSLLIADTLSRAAICNIASSEPGLTKERSNIPDAMLEKLRAQTSKDDDMQVLIGIIKRGWPEEKSELPPSARPYFDFRETMSIENGLIVRGEKVIVPKAMRGEIKRRLHAAHLSTDSMLRRARRTVFWPGIVAEIKQMADACETCQQSKPRNQKETLVQHETGQQPWEKVGSDIFKIIDHEDQYEGLLGLRNTPRQDGIIPAQVIFQREMRTLLPSLKMRNPDLTNIQKKKIEHNRKVKKQFDKKAKDMHPFQRHQTVYYQNPDKPGWNPGRIINRISDRSYGVEGETSGTYTRNRVHLRPKHTPFKSRIQVDDDVMPAEDTTMVEDNCQWRYSQSHVPQNGRAAHPTRPAVELQHSPQTDES
ncbi:hypothetical protein RRG08_039195 [Elysia crispata]|uniref:Integrase zinc-binding domain-containing protein n=1 Tax=Elysia crispata TaxID=231223 RepID=A0AAE1ASW5_9GAST|nr:hypothetical protein RRG08_039195 [Elysia crispata]